MYFLFFLSNSVLCANRAAKSLRGFLSSGGSCAIFAPVGEVGGGSEDDVRGGVERGFGAVLDDADKHTDGDDLRRGLTVNAEQRAGHWDEHQRATRDAGGACRTECGEEAEDECVQGVHGDVQGVRSGE